MSPYTAYWEIKYCKYKEDTQGLLHMPLKFTNKYVYLFFEYAY